MHYPYYNGGSDWGLWILMSLAMLVFWGILAWAVHNIVRHNNAHQDGKSQPLPGTGGSDALRILDERLARGEIEVANTPVEETSSKEAPRRHDPA